MQEKSKKDKLSLWGKKQKPPTKELPNIDCVVRTDMDSFDWSDADNNCAGTRITIDAYLDEIKDIINEQANKECTSIHVGMLATGGMRTQALKPWFKAKVVAHISKLLAHGDKNRIKKAEGAAVDGSLEGFFAVQTGIYQDDALTKLGKHDKQANKIGAMDLGGQTNQLAWEVDTASCPDANFPLTKNNNGQSKGPYALGGRHFCSQSAMWGLKENTDDQFRDHQRTHQQGIATDGVLKAGKESVAKGIDRFYILGQWMAPLKLCTKLTTLPTGKPCKEWMNKNGMPITEIEGVKTFDFDMDTYAKWHKYWKEEVMDKPAELTKIQDGGVTGWEKGDSQAGGNIGVSDKFMETINKMQMIPGSTKITGVLSAWNIGAQRHLKDLGLKIDHMAAGGSSFINQFEQIVHQMNGKMIREELVYED